MASQLRRITASDYVCLLEVVGGFISVDREVERLRTMRVFAYMERLALPLSDTRDVLESVIRELTGT